MKQQIDPILLQEIIRNQSEARRLGKEGCLLFNRVSTKMHEQESSLDQQDYDSTAYAQKLGFHIVYNFRVQETASKEDVRVVFQQMVGLLKSDLLDVKQVVFKSADRSSRNRFDKDQLDKLRKKHGVSIHYYSSGRVLHGNSHYTDELQDDIENLFATAFSRELSHKIREAYKHKILVKKQSPARVSPFGYFWDKNKKIHLVDTEAELTVRAIFDAFDASRLSVEEFAHHCNDRRLFPKSGIKWTKGRLHKFLINPFYCGYFRSKDGVYEGSHPAYFLKARYDERLARLGGNRNGEMNGKKSHLLSKFLFCVNCGRAYIGEAQEGAHNSGLYVYYRHKCPTESRFIRVKESDVFEALDECVDRVRFSPTFGQSIKNLFSPVVKKADSGQRKELEVLNARISRVHSQKMRLLDLFTLDEISKEELLEKRNQFEAQMKLLERERAAIQGRAEDAFDAIGDTIDKLKEIPERFVKAEDIGKANLLRSIADKVLRTPEGVIQIRWAKPYSLLLREEVAATIENRTLQPLMLSGFNFVSSCAQERT